MSPSHRSPARSLLPLAIAALILAMVEAACTVAGGDSLDQTDAPGAGMELGVVTGGIYQVGPYSAEAQGLDTHAEPILCNLASLGTRWIRIQAPWYDTSDQTYRTIVDTAHRHGMRVLVVVPDNASGVSCVADGDEARTQQLLGGYVAALDQLAGGTFAGHEPDAWEITNESNAGDGACGNQPRLGGRVLARLVRAAWTWEDSRGHSELIVSGAPLNLYFDACNARDGGRCTDGEEVWWDAYLDAPEMTDGPRPFDYFGVHPYQVFSYDANDPGGTLPGWQDQLTRQLGALEARLQGRFGGRVPMFASEFGWQECPAGTRLCQPSEALQTEGMARAVQAMRQSGAVDVALWYNARDERPRDGTEGGAFGLRRAWDGTRYPVRLELSEALRDLAGGVPDACGGTPLDMGVGLAADGSTSQTIADCYARAGGAPAVGAPFDNGGSAYAHRWGPGLVQDFRGGTLGPSDCIAADSGGPALMVRGDIRAEYLRQGGMDGWLGAPTDEEHNPDSPCQDFAGGHISWDWGAGDFRGATGACPD